MYSILRTFRDLELHSTGKWFGLSALIGVIAGLGAIGFHAISQIITHFAFVVPTGFPAAEASGEGQWIHQTAASAAEALPVDINPWLLLGIMALGGLASGVLVYTWAPEAEGHGTDAAIDAFHNKRGEIRTRIPLIKTLASAITLGTGGSAGREGPIAQIGAGVGSLLGRVLKLSARDRRILMAAGMGAGVGAIFRAPLAGALFAGEILYRDADLEADVIVPAAVSSTIAYSVFCFSLPPELRFVPLFGRNVGFAVSSPWELVPYTLLALVLVVAGAIYINGFYLTRDLFRKLPVLPHIKPMIGAVLAGIVGLSLFYMFASDPDALAVLGSGYGTLQKALDASEKLAISLMLAVAFVKMITTSLTISSGGSGGVFGPSMVIGGLLGAAVGRGFHWWQPELVSQPKAFAIVGMAGFFAGCARAPFSTVIMVTEMTGDYHLLLPTLWVATLCFLLGNRWTLYENQVASRLNSPAHRGDFIIDVLEGMRVEDVYKKEVQLKTFRESASLDEIVHEIPRTQQRYFPVVDDENHIKGIFSSEDVRSYLHNDWIWNVANARDVMNQPVVSVAPDDDLNTALTRFTALNVDELPVLDPESPDRLLGIIRRKETIAAYNRKRLELKRQVDEQEN